MQEKNEEQTYQLTPQGFALAQKIKSGEITNEELSELGIGEDHKKLLLFMLKYAENQINKN